MKWFVVFDGDVLVLATTSLENGWPLGKKVVTVAADSRDEAKERARHKLKRDSSGWTEEELI